MKINALRLHIYGAPVFLQLTETETEIETEKTLKRQLKLKLKLNNQN